jgi:rare lipoprotein A
MLTLGLGACAPAAARTDTGPTTIPAASPAATLVAVARNAATPSMTEELGIASWYGPGFAGRRTANGEIFDPSEMTAAHKELPFNSLVTVTNLDNGRSVVVRINDRGPFKPGRIIDLSRAGAEAIGMIGSGTAQVKVEVITLPEGMVRIGTTGGLLGFQAASRVHPIGTLLVIKPPLGGEPVVVRVVTREVPIESPADVLVGLELYAMVGSEVNLQVN